MPLHSPAPFGERILVMGGPGSGKTFDFLKTAELHQQSGSDARFTVFDTDNAMERMLYTDFSHLTNVNVLPVWSWEDIMRHAPTIAAMRPQDWCSVDLLSPTWDMVQEYFTAQVFDQSLGNFFLAARQADKKQSFEGWKDWPVINQLYRTFMQQLLRAPCNVYATATTDVIRADTDTRETINVFGHIGVKPKGQKHTPHFFHTVLWKVQHGQGWKVTTAKDRGRELMVGMDVTNFPMQYLVAKAGWKMA